ncbi:MAG: formylmethanofuran dehydrogenase subunit C [Methermicoccaceae archaeon]
MKMGEIILKKIKEADIPVEAEAICPDIFAGKSITEIEALTVFQGPIELPLSDFFEVSGDAGDTADDTTIIVEGDVSRFKRIGYKMSEGHIEIRGEGGMHIGSEMVGGDIVVKGSAGNWCGMDMKGGTLTIKGNGGDHIGSTYRGKWQGMSGGRIHILGNAGNNVGTAISGGNITIDGNVGGFCGLKQNGGTIVVGGDVWRALGAEMRAGTIVVKGKITWFTPGFQQVGEVDNPTLDGETFEGHYLKFIGDYAETKRAKGEMYVVKEANPDL